MMRFGTANGVSILVLGLAAVWTAIPTAALAASIQFFEGTPVALSGSGRRVLLSGVRTDQPVLNFSFSLRDSQAGLWDLDTRSYSIINATEFGYNILFHDLSKDGRTVVGGTNSFGAAGDARGPLRWREDSGFEELESPDLSSASLSSLVFSDFALSADGTTLVGASTRLRALGPSGQTHIWNAEGDVEDIIQNTSENRTILQFLSDDGKTFAGQEQIEAGGRLIGSAIRWTEAGGAESLLPESLQALSSSVSALSGDGQVAFGTYRPDSPDFTRAFVVDDENGFVDLGSLLPDAFRASIAAASEDGQLAVGQASYFGQEIGSSFQNHPSQAVLWDRVGGARTLAEILTELGVDLKGAELSSAVDISADGTHILGRTADGYAFLAIIPEPSTALMIGLGLIGLAAGSERCHRPQRAES